MTQSPLLKIKITKIDFFDPRRERVVPVKIYVPETQPTEKLPTILWSHGLGGSRDGAAFLGRFMAEHGFMVIHMTHIGTDSSLWEGKPGHPWDNIRDAHITRATTMNRFKDPRFVLDELERRAADGEAPFTKIDFRRLGMCGHSFGATTTQVMAGQKLGQGRWMYSMKEPRFKCAVAYSLGPTYNQQELPDKIYGSIDIPMLYMTGTEDDSPVSGKDYTTRLPIFESADGPNQHLLILKDGDHMVFAGSRGGLKDNPLREAHEKIIQNISLAFWLAYLNDSPKAQEWLHGEEVLKYLKDDAQWRVRNIN